MPQRFFDLSDDRSFPNRWHLDTPIDIQGHRVFDWDFKRGTPVHMPRGRLKIPMEIPGRPLDYSWAGLAIPVVHVKLASMLSELAPHDVQLIPADIEGQPDQYGVGLQLGPWVALFRERGSAGVMVPRTDLQPREALEEDTLPPPQVPAKQGSTELLYPPDLGSFTVGKDPSNELAIQDRFISSRHLQVTRCKAGFHVRGEPPGRLSARVRAKVGHDEARELPSCCHPGALPDGGRA